MRFERKPSIYARGLLLAGVSIVMLGVTEPQIALAVEMGAGALDVTFGKGTSDGTPDGVVNTSLGNGDDVANALARAEDGKIVVAGSHAQNGSTDVVVLRYNRDGTLDKSFGKANDGTPDGVVDYSLGAGDDVATAVAVQPDGRIVVAGYHVDGNSKNIFVMRVNRDGSLDKHFGADAGKDGTPDGVVNVSLGDGDDIARGIALEADGKIVVVGGTVKGSSANIVVARFNRNGSLDKSFGADGGNDGTPDGFVSLDLGEGDDVANGVAIQRDGKIVVAGSHRDSKSANVIVARFLKNGGLDKGFGKSDDGTPDGVVSESLGDGDDVARAVEIDAKGRIVLAGTTTAKDGSSNIVVARMKPDGTMDTSFGSDAGSDGTPDGFVATDLGKGNDEATSLALQADGKIVVAGDHEDNGSKNIVVARYLANGKLDADFGKSDDGAPDGVVNLSLGEGDDVANGVMMDGRKLIVVAGTTEAKDKSKNIVVLRLTEN